MAKKPNRRPMRMEAVAVREPTEFNPLPVGIKLDDKTVSELNFLLKPKQDEIIKVLSDMMKRKRWTQLKAATVLNIDQQRLGRILRGNVCVRGELMRLIWQTNEKDLRPEMLAREDYYFSWGKSRGFVPAPDKMFEPKGAKKQRVKYKLPQILRANTSKSKWLYADYAKSTKEIAEFLGVGVETVRMNLNMFRKLPKSMLVGAFASVGRAAQANIIIRGTASGFSGKLDEAMKEMGMVGNLPLDNNYPNQVVSLHEKNKIQS